MVELRQLKVPLYLLIACSAGLGLMVWSSYRRSGRPIHPHTASAGVYDVFDETLVKPVTPLDGIGFSPDGSYVATISGGDGFVSLFSSRGQAKTAWTRHVPGAKCVALTPGAKALIVYSLRNDDARDIAILRGSDGATVTHITVDGSIWSVTVSDDGQFAAVITSSKSVYVLSLGTDPKYKRWTLDGVGNSIAFTQNCTSVAVGTWDNGGISLYSRSGDADWTFPNSAARKHTDTSRLFEAFPAADRNSLLALSYSNVHHSDGTIYYWRSDSHQDPDWEHPIGADSTYPRAAISADGRFVVVTYVRTITRSDDSVDEHRVLLLDNAGHELWDKGGLLFSPSLISIAPDGHRVTVSDGIRNLYHINGDGKISASWPQGTEASTVGLLRQVIPSADGKKLLVYTGDGTVRVMSLERQSP